MFNLSPITLGITLSILGLLFLMLVRLSLRTVPKLKFQNKVASPSPFSIDLASHNNAILVVEPGGRVKYTNSLAQEWFGFAKDEIDLESLARKTRPGDAFLGLCVQEGQAHFSLDGRLVQGFSYLIPNGSSDVMVISLQHLKLVGRSSLQSDSDGATSEPSGGTPREYFEVFAELSQAMASNLDLQTTIKTILESIENLIPADYAEVTIWSKDKEHLVPYRLFGIPGKDGHIEQISNLNSADDGYSGYLINHRSPLFIPDTEEFITIKPAANHEKYPLKSYIGVPLLIAGELIGTLELGATSSKAFTQDDLEVLKLISGQAAIALHNALLYQEERRRVEELAGLAHLAQISNTFYEHQELIARLVEAIRPLLEVEIIGFLIYDETRRMLKGQAPFWGLPSEFVQLYQTTIPKASQADEIWSAQQVIHARNAPEDVRLQLLGLDDHAIAAGINETVLVPLAASERNLGYLQIANKLDGTKFNHSDLRFLAIIAGQVALIFENALLFKQSRRRAQRAEALRRIASLSSSLATKDEILRWSLHELARLIQADAAAIFLLDETNGELRLHRDSLFGLSSQTAHQFTRLPVDDCQLNLTVTGSQQAFFTYDASQDNRVLPAYRPLIENFKFKSAIDVPLIVHDKGIGEIMFGSYQADFFNRADIQTVAIAAGQLAGAVEHATLSSQTDQNLQRRVKHLTALTRISREFSATTDLKYLLKRVHDETLRVTGADCGTTLMLNGKESPEVEPKVVFYVGEEPRIPLNELDREVLASGRAIIIQDFEDHESPAYASNQNDRTFHSTSAHNGIRSALLVPIRYQEQTTGLIHLHAKKPDHFDTLALEITQALALQTATALGNALRYQDQLRQNARLNRQVETLTKLWETSRIFQTQKLLDDHPLEESLTRIAKSIQETTPFQTVVISVYDPERDLLRPTANAGLPAELIEQIKEIPQSWSEVKTLLQDDFKINNAYFIPREKLPAVPPDVHIFMSLSLEERPKESRLWHSGDVLVVPVFDYSSEPLGLISVDSPEDELRPDRVTIESVALFAVQAGLTIEAHQIFTQEKARIARLRERLGDIEQNSQKTQNHAQLASLVVPSRSSNTSSVDEQIKRIETSLNIAQAVHGLSDRSDVLLTLGERLLTQMDMETVLIAASSDRGIKLIYSLGSVPPGINPSALLGQRNPIQYSLQTNENVVVADIQESARWSKSPLLQSLAARSFICFLLSSDSHPEFVVLGISHSRLEDSIAEDNQALDLLVRQIAIALQNANLLADTKRRLEEVNHLLEFSRQVVSLKPKRVLQSLVDTARQIVSAADAVAVLMWEPDRDGLIVRSAAGYPNVSRLQEIVYPLDNSLPGSVLQKGGPLRLDEIDFPQHYKLSQDDLIRYRDATGGKLPLSSLLIPVISSQPGQSERNSGAIKGVLLLDSFSEHGAFTGDDQSIIASLAHQTALTLENILLSQASEQRTGQIQALTGVSAMIASNLQADELVASLLAQMQSVLPFDTGTLWLREGNTLTVRAASGFSDAEERDGLSVAIEDSQLFNQMEATGLPIFVGDVRDDVRFAAMRDYTYLSWLGLPLVAKGEMIGLIALEKREADFYSSDDMQLGLAFASQSATALENATLFKESQIRAQALDQRSRRLAVLHRLSTNLSATLDREQIYRLTIEELSQAVDCSAVSIVIVETGSLDGAARERDLSPSMKATLVDEVPIRNTGLPLELPAVPMFDRLRKTMGVYTTEKAIQQQELAPLADFLNERSTRSLLICPISTGEGLHALLLIHNDQSHHYSAEEAELVRTIGNQAAIAIENARLFVETRRLTEDLEQRVKERTAQLAQEHHRIATLLRITTELSASLDLEQVLNRTLKVLNEVAKAETISCLIWRPGESKLREAARFNRDDARQGMDLNDEDEPDSGLAGWVISNRKAALVTDRLNDSYWRAHLNQWDHYRSAMGVPLMVGEELVGVLLLFHSQAGHFSEDQLELIQATGNQIAVTINNAELYNLIRDQAEDLGTMLRVQQIETSRSRAILESVAEGVLVTDDENKITLFNASAEKMLGLSRQQVVGRSLEHFSGLFGKAALSWMSTIRNWSNEPGDYQPGQSYSERINLEAGRVVSVQLAPVYIQTEFLGTVSIFHDITHQVEVDRLKTEFVATVSHELRTPMTSIKGYVDVLLMGAAGALNDQQTHFLKTVQENTQRLTILVNDLLDVSRIEANRVKLALQPLDLNSMAEEIIAEFQQRSAEDNKSMEFSLDFPPDLARVTGDPERILQILVSLLDNAYHYTHEAGEITLRARQKDNDVQVDVIDNGIGIPAEDQQHVFERFFRGENPLVLETSGTGLGLSIVRQLVSMHAGSIWLESDGIPGNGSTFSFTLPVYNPKQ